MKHSHSFFRLFILLLLLAYPASGMLFGQPLEKVIGKVVDEETGQPLPFASLRLKGRNYGTASNIEGYFEFKYPRAYRSDTLVATMVGYHSAHWPLDKPSNSDTLVIQMRPNPIRLDEVTVMPHEPSGRELMEKALDNIKNNYPTSPFIMHGFFRDLKLENEECAFLLEAAVRIYDKRYHRAPRILRDLQERVAIDKIRATSNYIRQEAWKEALSKENALKELLGNNLLRYQYGPFDLKEEQTYRRSHEVRLDSQLLYVVEVSEFPQTQIFIDSETYGIHKFVYRSKGERVLKPDSKTAKEGTELVIVSQHIQFEYQPYQGKLYLKYIFSDTQYEERDKDSQKAIHTSRLKLNLLISSVDTEGVEKIRGRETMDKYNNLEEQVQRYDEDFWKNYNLLKRNPIEGKLIEDLMKKAHSTKIFTRKP